MIRVISLPDGCEITHFHKKFFEPDCLSPLRWVVHEWFEKARESWLNFGWIPLRDWSNPSMNHGSVFMGFNPILWSDPGWISLERSRFYGQIRVEFGWTSLEFSRITLNRGWIFIALNVILWTDLDRICLNLSWLCLIAFGRLLVESLSRNWIESCLNLLYIFVSKSLLLLRKLRYFLLSLRCIEATVNVR